MALAVLHVRSTWSRSNRVPLRYPPGQRSPSRSAPHRGPAAGIADARDHRPPCFHAIALNATSDFGRPSTRSTPSRIRSRSGWSCRSDVPAGTGRRSPSRGPGRARGTRSTARRRRDDLAPSPAVAGPRGRHRRPVRRTEAARVVDPAKHAQVDDLDRDALIRGGGSARRGRPGPGPEDDEGDVGTRTGHRAAPIGGTRSSRGLGPGPPRRGRGNDAWARRTHRVALATAC